jgi:hypothetical protein
VNCILITAHVPYSLLANKSLSSELLELDRDEDFSSAFAYLPTNKVNHIQYIGISSIVHLPSRWGGNIGHWHDIVKPRIIITVFMMESGPVVVTAAPVMISVIAATFRNPFAVILIEWLPQVSVAAIVGMFELILVVHICIRASAVIA